MHILFINLTFPRSENEYYPWGPSGLHKKEFNIFKFYNKIKYNIK